MTIKVKVESAPSAKDRGFLYVRSNDVAVVSVTGERDAPSTSLRTVLQSCLVQFEAFFSGWLRALPGHHTIILVATPAWDQHNALSRHRGIWRSEGLRWLSGDAQRSPSVEIREEGGTRFAGLAEINDANLFDAADYARTHGASFLLVSRRTDLTEERVRSMVTKVLPNGQGVLEWSNVVGLVDQGADICVRVSGGFDDRDVSIDAFLSAALLRKVEEPKFKDPPLSGGTPRFGEGGRRDGE